MDRHHSNSSQMREVLQPDAHKERSNSPHNSKKDMGGQETRPKTGNSKPELKCDGMNTPSSPGSMNQKFWDGTSPTNEMGGFFGSGASSHKEPLGDQLLKPEKVHATCSPSQGEAGKGPKLYSEGKPYGSEVSSGASSSRKAGGESSRFHDGACGSGTHSSYSTEKSPSPQWEGQSFGREGQSSKFESSNKSSRIKYKGNPKPEMILLTNGGGQTGAEKRDQFEDRPVPMETGRDERWGRHRWEDIPSKCCSLDELKRFPECGCNFGTLNFSRTHAVLLDVNAFMSGEWRPQTGQLDWSHNSVKMPHSQGNVVTVSKMMTSKSVRRWDVISEQLGSLAKKKSATVKDVEKTIFKLNPKYEGQWSFGALLSFVKAVPKTDNYYEALFPKIAKLALRLPDSVKKAVPLLRRGHSAAVTLSQVQISCLLANAFFCTFPHRNTTAPNAEYSNFPTINFNSLFEDGSDRKKQKLRAIMHYFNVVTDEKTRPKGMVTFERRCLRDLDTPQWRSCVEKMPKLHVTANGAIEKEGEGMLQVDFAASRIGGGVLGNGLVQEEVLFLINPELILSRLFTEKLDDNECLIIKGSQQFSDYTGFSDTFEWTKPHDDHLGRDSWARKQRHILAIDALHYRDRMDQYNMRKVTRELNKAFCGFKRQKDDTPDIATGKWGCGAFSGDPQLKAIIQLMAAAVADRGLAFFTFHDYKLRDELDRVYTLLVTKDVSVGKLYRLLEDYCDCVHRKRLHEDLFDFICLKVQTPGYLSRL